MPQKYVCHSAKVWKIAEKFGWLPGARYTNLRDVRLADRLGFLDIDWKNYNFRKHIAAAKATNPKITVAQDVVDAKDLDLILDQAYSLLEFSDDVIIVPKDISMANMILYLIPDCFVLGYSVPTKYGGTEIGPECFGNREVHLLGGRPDKQRQLAERMAVGSIDTNRFTLDASFGDYFNGERFQRHPIGGYERCIADSLANINRVWDDYRPSLALKRSENGRVRSA